MEFFEGFIGELLGIFLSGLGIGSMVVKRERVVAHKRNGSNNNQIK